MAAPSVRDHLAQLVGQTISTLTGAPNRVLEVRADVVMVGTNRSPDGRPVPLAAVQAAADRVFDGEEVEINPASVGYRSAFVGAALASMPGVEALDDPLRVRLSKR